MPLTLSSIENDIKSTNIYDSKIQQMWLNSTIIKGQWCTSAFLGRAVVLFLLLLLFLCSFFFIIFQRNHDLLLHDPREGTQHIPITSSNRRCGNSKQNTLLCLFEQQFNMQALYSSCRQRSTLILSIQRLNTVSVIWIILYKC